MNFKKYVFIMLLFLIINIEMVNAFSIEMAEEQKTYYSSNFYQKSEYLNPLKDYSNDSELIYEYESMINNDYTTDLCNNYLENLQKQVDEGYKIYVYVERVKIIPIICCEEYEYNLYNLENNNITIDEIDNGIELSVKDYVEENGGKEAFLEIKKDDITVNIPIHVKSENNIIEINSLSEITDPNGSYKLKNDTILDYPIKTFSGELDGNGKTIYVSQDAMNVFNILQNATVHDFVIKDKEKNVKREINLAGNGTTFGTLSKQANYSNIYNIINESTLIVDMGNTSTVFGGIIGKTVGCTLSNLKNSSGTIDFSGLGQGVAVGGIIGNDLASRINFSYNESNISSFASTNAIFYKDSYGGIVGFGEQTNINNSHNKGEISTFYGNSGGIIGLAQGKIDIENSSNIANIYGGFRVGGILGKIVSVFNELYNEVVINKSFSIGDTSSRYSGSFSGGLVGGDGNSVDGDEYCDTCRIEINNSYVFGQTPHDTNVGSFVGRISEIEINNSYSMYKQNIRDCSTANLSNPELKKFSFVASRANLKSATYTNVYLLKERLICKYFHNGAIMPDPNKYESYEKTFEELKEQITYVGFDFDNVWEIKNVGAFPTLKDNEFVQAVSLNKKKTENDGNIIITDFDTKYNIYDYIKVEPENVSVPLKYESRDNLDLKINANGDIDLMTDRSGEIIFSTSDGSELEKSIPVYIDIEDGLHIMYFENFNNSINFGIIANYGEGMDNPSDGISDIRISDEFGTLIDISEKYKINNTHRKYFDLEIDTTDFNDGKYTLYISDEKGYSINYDFVFERSVTDIILNEDELIVFKNDTNDINFTVEPENATNKKLNYESLDEAIAIVDETGKVTGIETGTTLIKVSTIDGSNIEKIFNVRVIDKNILINKLHSSENLYEGLNGTIEVSVTIKDFEDDNIVPRIEKFNDDTNEDLIQHFTVTKGEVITIDNKKKFTLTIDLPMNNDKISAGKYELNLSDENGNDSNTILFTIKDIIHVNSVVIKSPNERYIGVGKEINLEAEVLPNTAFEKSVEWFSSNENVATVDENGKVYPKSLGEVTIFAKSKDKDITAEFTFQVINQIESIEVNAIINSDGTREPIYNNQISICDSCQIKLETLITPSESDIQTLKYYFLHDNFAIVGEDGTITGVNPGTTTLYISSEDESGTSVSLDLTVTPVNVTSISLDKTNIKLKVNQTEKLNATIEPENATNKALIWSSNDETKVKVDQYGNITALSPGEAEITVQSAEEGLSASCRVKVEDPKILINTININSNHNGVLYNNYGGVVNFSIDLQDIEVANNFNYVLLKSGDNTSANLKDKVNIELKNGVLELTIPENTLSAGEYNFYVTSDEIESNVISFTINDFIEASGIIFKYKNKENEYENINNNKIILLQEDYLDIIGEIINKDESTIQTIAFSIENENIATINNNEKIEAISVGDTKLIASVGDKSFEIDLKVIDIPNIAFGNEITYQSNVPGNTTIDNYFGGTITIEKTITNMTDDMSFERMENLIGGCFGYDYNLENKVTINVSSHCLAGANNTQLQAGDYTYKEKIHVNDTKMTVLEFEQIYNIEEYIPLNAITANIEKINLKINETYDLDNIDKTFDLSNATNKNVKYDVISGNDIITISDGVLTGTKGGIATIKVVSVYNSDAYDILTVIVNPEIKDITEDDITIVSNYNNKLYQGYGGQITVNIGVENIPVGETLTVNYYKDEVKQEDMTNILDLTGTEVKDNNTLEVTLFPNANLKAGKYKIEFCYTNAISKSFTFDVIEPKKISEIKADDNITLLVGQETDLKYEILPSDAFNQDLDITIRNKDTSQQTPVATLNKGKIKGERVGEAIITLTAKDGSNVVKTIIVTVKESIIKVTEIKLNKTNVTLEVGKSEIITATVEPSDATNKTLIWSSSNTSVATVDQNGLIKGVKAGTATIEVKPYDGSNVVKTIIVTVKEPIIKVTEIKLNKTNVTLEVGESETITATVKPDNSTNKTLTWSSSNTSVATVTNKGKIKGVKEGKATITVTNEDSGETAKIKVTVEKNEYLDFKNNINVNTDNGTKYLNGLGMSSTYQNLKSNINTNLNITLKDKNGTVITKDSDIIGTGMKLIIGNNTYDIVIKGDMSGDGKMSITDLSQMRYHLAKVSGKVKSGAYQQAGDMNDSNSVTITDLSQMRKKLAGVN